MDEDEEEFVVRIVDKDDVALRESGVKDTGKRGFCKRDMSAGTILP